MPITGLVKPNTYRDSVALMVLSTALSEREGVLQAAAMMATPANLEILRATGLWTSAFEGAGPNDLLLVVEGHDERAAAAALSDAEVLLAAAGHGGGGAGLALNANAWRPRTLRRAVEVRPDANLALISVPGAHAALEAQQALLAGLHVFLFSDNVPLGDEVALKRLAAERGLLVMGPDCGTALIGGVPLGFANAVRRGQIGVVGSSGTGLQEVTSLIHRLGEGVSHAIGTGSRDLSAAVGGLSFLAAVDALAADPGTRVLVAIAKPGDPMVEARVLERLRACGKPSVVYFLGGTDLAGAPDSEAGAPHAPTTTAARGGGGARSTDLPTGRRGVAGHSGEAVAAVRAADLEHAARCAVALARGEPPPAPAGSAEAEAIAAQIVAGLAPGQIAVRGLFAGGTLAQELAAALALSLDLDARTSAGARPGEVFRAGAHRVLDLGDDAYTRGRPHPLIDPRLRNAELVAQAESGEVALFVLDVILGFGSHADPAGALAPAVAQAREAAGRRLEVLASLCGTEADSQGYERQRAALEASGVRVAPSSSAAAAIAARVVARLAEAAR